jgi:hypothetical protein
MAVAACARCGASLGGWYRPGTQCLECERSDVEARLERQAALEQPRPCAECGQPFMPTQMTARFCSSPCRLRAWRRANAAAVG